MLVGESVCQWTRAVVLALESASGDEENEWKISQIRKELTEIQYDTTMGGGEGGLTLKEIASGI